MSSSLPQHNYRPIIAYQNNRSSIDGIFSVLKLLNGDYKTRYTIEGKSTEPRYSCTLLDQYFDNKENTAFWSTDDKPEITVKFDSPFILSGYAIINSVQQETNSAPEAWVVYGVDSDGIRHPLDTQTDQKFCESDSRPYVCSKMIVKGYEINKPEKYIFNEYVFHQTMNSCEFSYLFFKAIDFFGTLCGLGGVCSLFPVTYQLRNPIQISNIIIHFILS